MKTPMLESPLSYFVLIFCGIIFWPMITFGQEQSLSELEKQVNLYTNQDTVKVNLLVSLASKQLRGNVVLSKNTCQKALTLAKKLKFDLGEAKSLEIMAIALQNMGSPEAWDKLAEAMKLHEKLGNQVGIIHCIRLFGYMYESQGDYPTSLEYYYKALLLAEEGQSEETKVHLMLKIGYSYSLLGDYPKAKEYLSTQLAKAQELKNQELINLATGFLGDFYAKTKQYETAISYFKKEDIAQDNIINQANRQLNIANCLAMMGDCEPALEMAKTALSQIEVLNQKTENTWGLLVMARVMMCQKNYVQAIVSAKKCLEYVSTINHKEFERDATEILFLANKQLNNIVESKRYQMAFEAMSDSLTGQNTRQRSEVMHLNYELETQKSQIELMGKERELNDAQSKNQRLLSIIAILAFVVISSVAVYFIRTNKIQKQNNQLLFDQKQEIELQRHTAEKALKDLTDTQNQLIQSEKLASLGELTAGIAHEIQNPLNFVNNFAELSVELIRELQAEKLKTKAERDETLENELLDDLAQNQEKINYHGKRASSIVKGMLEHSRMSAGVKEPTDINKLADEYLRLSYHGLRAKDKNSSTKQFNSNFEIITDLDMPLVNMVSQDIGRVFLNLINNAFHAVADQALHTTDKDYKPSVAVIIQKENKMAKVKIIDNGTGMNEATKAKIFNPFFTTKPTGQGTGLGLSLAYDIIIKGHGGTIDVESVEGQGTTFIVKLPI